MIPTLIAFALLVGGVVGGYLPRVPGAALSLAGVLVYWWASGYSQPGTLVLAALVSVTVLAVLARVGAWLFADRLVDASPLSATLAGVVGLVLFPFLGTIGLFAGAVATVFVVEYIRRRNARQSLAAALGVVFGTLASRVVETLLALFVLVVMAVLVL